MSFNQAKLLMAQFKVFKQTNALLKQVYCQGETIFIKTALNVLGPAETKMSQEIKKLKQDDNCLD